MGFFFEEGVFFSVWGGDDEWRFLGGRSGCGFLLCEIMAGRVGSLCLELCRLPDGYARSVAPEMTGREIL